MKKVILAMLPFALVACSAPSQQSTVPMDMKAVEAYQQKVASGQTVNPNDKQADWEMNVSDKRQKVVIKRGYPTVYPSIYYGYGHHHHHSGVGVRLGHW